MELAHLKLHPNKNEEKTRFITVANTLFTAQKLFPAFNQGPCVIRGRIYLNQREVSFYLDWNIYSHLGSDKMM